MHYVKSTKELQQPALEIARRVSRQLELAMLLEVSAYPKPGNVHRTRDYSGTKFEHFLASAVSARPYFERAGKRGVLISEGKISSQEANIGSTIRDAVIGTSHSHHGGNTSLGTVMLFVPLAVASGLTFAQCSFSHSRLRRNLKQILMSTTAADAVALYDAIAYVRPGGLGEVPELDVKDPGSRRRIIRGGLNLLDIARLAAHRDSICKEWVTGYQTTFELGYTYFRRELSRTQDFNEATVNTYLKILSEIPDTLIARKATLQKARWVSSRARKALTLGGFRTWRGRKEIERLDDQLGKNSNLLNPGATADITASVLALATLSGYRP
jgi:triphosphoribosyl-dephospho-CoA synthase